MTTTIPPFFLIAGFGLLLGLLFGALCFRASSMGRRVGLIVLALVCMAPAGFLAVLMHPELVDSRFRTYKAFYHDIREGMSRPEIDALIARHYPPDGPRKRPTIMDDTPARLGFFMNPETSVEPNCEGIFLTLQDGRVTQKRYSED